MVPGIGESFSYCIRMTLVDYVIKEDAGKQPYGNNKAMEVRRTAGKKGTDS